VLHPIQIHDLRVALATSTGVVWEGPSAPAADLGAFASLYDVDVFKSRDCASVNLGADRQGVMLPIGSSAGLVYSMNTKELTLEFSEHSSQETMVTISLPVGAGVLRADANGGVAIISDKE
jgi:hypothetical protein